jgi:hypothetical protein
MRFGMCITCITLVANPPRSGALCSFKTLAFGTSSALVGLEGEGMSTAPVSGLRVTSTNVDDSDSWSLTISVLYCED